MWSRKAARDARGRRRPRLECLEQRALLTAPGTLPAAQFAPATSGTIVPSNTTNFDQIIGASAARAQYKVDGSGQSVAVIDTGVNYNNEDLGSGFGPGHKVVAGFDFADNSADPIAADQHGTAVAGLIAGSDPADPGVAPGADIVALRVFNGGGGSSFTDVAKALQWVVDNHATYNITVVNMSISDGNNYSSNWFAEDGGVGEQITDLVNQLAALNIPVVAAAGNNFSGPQGMGFTAIIPTTISVTSTDGSGNLVGNAQRLGASLGGASATDIASPGAGLYAPAGGTDAFGPVSGTSFATPLVSGSVVLLQQIYQQRFGTLPSVAQVDGWLKAGADPVNDGSTGTGIGGLDIPKAAALIPTPTPAPSPPTPSPPPPSSNPSPPQPTPPPSVVGTPAPTPPPTPVPPPPPPTPVPPPPPPTPVPPPPPTPTPPPASNPAGSTGSTPTVQTEVYLDGKDLGAVSSSQADAGWSAFLSLFTGGITSVESWNAGGSAATPAAIPITGASLGSIQQWSAPASDLSGSPQPQGTMQIAANDLTSPPQPQGTVQVVANVNPFAIKHAAHPKPAAVHPRTAAAHHFPRAWDAGFVGSRRHR